MDGEAWWATEHGVTKSHIWLSDFTFTFIDKLTLVYLHQIFYIWSITTVMEENILVLWNYMLKYLELKEHSVCNSHQIRSDQSLSRVRLFATPWIAARQASLSITTQTHVHRVTDAIQPSHPLLSPSPLAPSPSQHQSLFQWVNSSHEVAKVLEFQL